MKLRKLVNIDWVHVSPGLVSRKEWGEGGDVEMTIKTRNYL